MIGELHLFLFTHKLLVSIIVQRQRELEVAPRKEDFVGQRSKMGLL